ncbi:hypothetical protein [Xanthomonas campestris]|uniref:hypothetical protein n=1 Tax=Xanthomonas campestris TaxID=339 RepID=UPI00388DAFC2
MTDNGYLSLDKAHLTKMQRERRASIRRIDYTPSRDALAAFEARQTQERPGSIAATNSAVLDAIVTEWAELDRNKETGSRSAQDSEGPAGIHAPVRAYTYESGRCALWARSSRRQRQRKKAGRW